LHAPLMDEGWMVECADYPADAIRLVMRKKFGAVILDSGGFGLDARDAAVIIRNLNDEIRVIVLGENGFGPDIYSLEKPLDLVRLKRMIKGISAHRKSLKSTLKSNR